MLDATGSEQQAAEWTCECGQAYRIAVLRGERRFWPRNSVDGYSRHGLPEKACCIRCACLLPKRDLKAVLGAEAVTSRT